MIDKLEMQSKLMPALNTYNKTASAVDISKQFQTFLTDALDKTKVQQKEVDLLTTQFINGDLSDVHQLLIASEQAALGLELTVEIRNKVISAYQEIMRMQI